MTNRLQTLGLIAGLLSPMTGHADELVRRRGRCQSLTVADRAASKRCADEMLVQVTDTGERAFVFRADDAVVLFVAIDAPDATGMRDLPMNRLQFGLRREAEAIPVLSGSCRSTNAAATWRAKTVCEAETIKGRFAASFVTIDGATEPVRPSDSGEPSP